MNQLKITVADSSSGAAFEMKVRILNLYLLESILLGVAISTKIFEVNRGI